MCSRETSVLTSKSSVYFIATSLRLVWRRHCQSVRVPSLICILLRFIADIEHNARLRISNGGESKHTPQTLEITRPTLNNCVIQKYMRLIDLALSSVRRSLVS